jgi:hypothetical protein
LKIESYGFKLVIIREFNIKKIFVDRCHSLFSPDDLNIVPIIVFKNVFVNMVLRLLQSVFATSMVSL